MAAGSVREGFRYLYITAACAARIEYLCFSSPYPNLRVRADAKSYLDLGVYEGYAARTRRVHVFKFEASDGTSTVSENLTIRVYPPNSAPVIQAVGAFPAT